MKFSTITTLILIFLGFSSLQAQVQVQISKKVYQHSGKDANKCVECHDIKEGNEFVHMPARIGSCSTCHNIFNKGKDLLRVKDDPKMCVICHPKQRLILKKDKNVHPSVKKACTGCHDPHAGERRFRLKHDKRKDLCLSCHTEKKEWIESVKNKHGAIYLEDGGCFGCHDPHGTSRPKMLRVDSTKELCLSCHNKPLKREEDGAMLPDMAKHLKENTKWHGPIVAGECTGCHNPHGSNNSRMLKGPYPKEYTVKFKPEKYVCFNCHQSEKITKGITIEYTNFRKNKKNLHTVHVKNALIACSTCHDFHGVKEDIPLLKDKTNFGRAKFKLRFIKNADGGSCNPICHQKREYKRGIFEPKLIKADKPKL
jgi:predicted CXXCH cytochrome family protein